MSDTAVPEISSALLAERHERKRRLAAAFRLFAHFDFDDGVAGHMTVRDPVRSDAFWVNPLGVYFGHMRASDLVLVDHAGKIIEGGARPINHAAFAIHSQVHAARPEVQAACHAHSAYGQAFSTLGRLLDPLTQDACAFFEDHAIYREFSGVVGSTDEGKRIAAALGTRKAAILRNHGLLTVGASIDEAAWWFITLERCCHVQLTAEAAGEPQRIPDEVARLTRDQVGSGAVGWLSFQPLYEKMIRSQPELLE